MSLFKQITLKIKAFFQLDIKQSLNYLLYKIGLHSGYFRLVTPEININALLEDNQLHPDWFIDPPEMKTMLGISDLESASVFIEADEILNKQFRYFGGEPKPLNLAPEKDPVHWTYYETGKAKSETEDIKFIWEPARFNWALTMAKAYFLRGREEYAATFWQYFEEFSQANPPNKGLNWISSQEVALRLITLVFGVHIMRASQHSTPERKKELFLSIANHADRIPPTICYARAQNNNHLVSEAAGLFTAATFLPGHPHAARWRKIGMKWFKHAVLTQVAPDGTYIQHSTNYQRLFLTLALWMNFLVEKEGDVLPDEILNQLARATEWLTVRMDHTTGRVPNLGHNDGSYFLPLTLLPYDDYRPVIQAASRVFLAKPALPPGPWDEFSVMLEIPIITKIKKPSKKSRENHLIIGDENDWAALRTVNYSSRPAHADQLHVDIWHKGLNIALDAGTFQYNAAPPWENALAATRIHNTITINNYDQMTKAGKFLWLDWTQAEVIKKTKQSITALHTGYAQMGILHQRTLRMESGNEKSKNRKKRAEVSWTILDELLPAGETTPHFDACLNWLIPDWPYEIRGNEIALNSPTGKIVIDFQYTNSESSLEVFRAGKSMQTKKKDENLGWYSPTYGLKKPALSIRFSVSASTPITITSTFKFEK